MTDDWEMYQGEDRYPYYVVMDGATPPETVDLDAPFAPWTAATWTATPVDGGGPAILKHMDDILPAVPVGSPVLTIGVDPITPTVKNCVFVHLAPTDTGTLMGQFYHELRITINDEQVVVYPPVSTKATFTVVESDTWDMSTDPPTPRLHRVDSPKNLWGDG